MSIAKTFCDVLLLPRLEVTTTYACESNSWPCDRRRLRWWRQSTATPNFSTNIQCTTVDISSRTLYYYGYRASAKLLDFSHDTPNGASAFDSTWNFGHQQLTLSAIGGKFLRIVFGAIIAWRFLFSLHLAQHPGGEGTKLCFCSYDRFV